MVIRILIEYLMVSGLKGSKSGLLCIASYGLLENYLFKSLLFYNLKLQWDSKNILNLGFFSLQVAVRVICAEIWICNIIAGVWDCLLCMYGENGGHFHDFSADLVR